MIPSRTLEWLVVLLITASSSTEQQEKSKPHLILIVADDLGWYDVSWHNPKALTPNLEELAKGGVLLNQSYVQPICTPTRSALMTGRYPFTLGRQHNVLWPEEPTGLTIKRQLIPQALKEAGYSTHAVGKWHLGFCSWDYTPTSRGYDTFWGYYTGAEDYYHHTRATWGSEEDKEFPTREDEEPISEPPASSYNESSIRFGFDFRNNTEPEYDVDGQYSTYLFSSYIESLLENRNPKDPMFLYLPFQSVHAPLQVPENYTRPFEHIKDKERRIKLGMVYAMDEAVGRIVAALKSSGHYDNSVIVFTTDNGGPTVSAGNNWPLRGNKTTLWEGGTRGVAFVHSPLLPSKGIVSNKLIHVTDWFPTLVGLGGGTVPGDTDGYDQWEAITTSAPSPRIEMIYNIDLTKSESAGIRMGDYKLLVGNPGPGEWTPPPEGKPGAAQDIYSLGDFSQMSDKSSTKLEVTGSIREQNSIHGLDSLDFGVSGDAQTNFRPDGDVVTVGDLDLNVDSYPLLKSIMTSGTPMRLFNIMRDPEERHNMAADRADVVQILLGLLQFAMVDYVDPDTPPYDPAANPKYWNNTWTPGWCHAK